MSDTSENKLKENAMIILYSIADSSNEVNYNTLKRYLYLYYFTLSFVNKTHEEESIEVVVEKGDIRIIGFDSALSYFIASNFVEKRENTIVINEELRSFVSKLISNQNGSLFQKYLVIHPFINILRSYNDQFVFTIFFNEPTLLSASKRGLEEIHSTDSRLTSLLSTFKQKVKDDQVDEYDILAYWIDFVLKYYYS